MLDQSFIAGDIAVCLKDSQKKVLMQNPHCLDICGDKSGMICDSGCMGIYNNDQDHQWQKWGTRLYKNSHIDGRFFDITLLCTSEHIFSFLQPLDDKYETAIQFYESKGLTRREIQIMSLLIRGQPNSEICCSLHVSNATLKTHLNNIYRKLRETDTSPDFLPACRVSAI